MVDFIFTKITGEITFVFILILIFHILLIKNRKRDATLLLISSLSTIGVVWLLKNILRINRPDNPIIDMNGYGMPSGHSALSIFLGYMIYILFVNRLEKKYKYPILIGIIILVISIGLSRLYFNVHTPLQILVGYLIGLIVPILSNKIIDKR